jgi:hypothetical protein
MMLLARRTKIPATAAKLNLPRLDKKTFSLLVSQQFNPLNHVSAIANFIPIPTGYPTRNAAMRAWLHEVLRSRQVIVNDYNLPLGTVEIQFERYEATQRALEEQKSRLVHSGLPQGSPLSPFLSILVLNHVYKLSRAQFPNVGWLFYADDGMFYSNHDQEFQAFLQWIPKALGEFGISISKEKSQLAVLYNRPVVERTKFLGIVFEHESGKIYSETRSGKSLLYTYKDIVAFSAQLRDNKEEIEKSFGINPYENTHSILYLFLLWKMETWEPNKRSLFFARFISRLDSTQKKAVQRFIELDTSALAKAMRFTLQVKDPFKESKVMLNNLFEKVKSLTEVKTGLFSGPFGGLIQSRIYGGSETVAAFDTASGSQDFVLRVIPNSLGHVLKSKIPEHINLHNGSSYASGEMVRLLGSIVKGKKKPVLRGGPVLAPY